MSSLFIMSSHLNVSVSSLLHSSLSISRFAMTKSIFQKYYYIYVMLVKRIGDRSRVWIILKITRIMGNLIKVLSTLGKLSHLLHIILTPPILSSPSHVKFSLYFRPSQNFVKVCKMWLCSLFRHNSCFCIVRW